MNGDQYMATAYQGDAPPIEEHNGLALGLFCGSIAMVLGLAYVFGRRLKASERTFPG